MTHLFLIALLAATPADSQHPSWMIGTWGWQNAGEREADCGSDHATTYQRDGAYYFIDQRGKWRIEENRLIETVTDPGESGNPADRGTSKIFEFKKVGPGVLEVSGEYPGRLVKCPGD